MGNIHPISLPYEISQRNLSHNAAIRALAFKWLRILFRCWKNRVPYDETLYLAALEKRRLHTVSDDSAVPNLDWRRVAGFFKLSVIPTQ
jgi:hypothetical protein